MSKKSISLVVVALAAIVLAACQPTFPENAAATATQQGSKAAIDWPAATASAPEDPVVGYEVYVDQSLVTTISPSFTRCLLQGLSAGTSYEVEVQAVDLENHRSAALLASFTTPLVDDSANPLDCNPVGD